MGDIYIDSVSGSNTSPYDTWAKAATSLPTALLSGSAGDNFVINHLHSQSGASDSLASPGTRSNPCTLTSSNTSDVYTKAISVQWADSSDISCTGFMICHGINFSANDDINSPSPCWEFNDSTLTMSGGGSFFSIEGATTSPLRMKDVDMTTSSTSYVFWGGTYIDATIDGLTLTASSATSIFINPIIRKNIVTMTNSDISDVGAMFSGSIGYGAKYNFSRLKIQSTFTYSTEFLHDDDTEVNYYSCDNGDDYHFFYFKRYRGVALESTTVKRTGGAYYDKANPTTTLFSTEFQPSSNVVAYTQPLRIKIAELEPDLTSANTLTFHLAFGDDSAAITPFNNDEAWIEIEQNSDALTSKALGLTDNTKPDDILTTPTQLTASTEAWTSNATTLELDYAYSDKRQIAVDTVAVSGMTNGQVTAYLCIAKHVSTVEIFVCPSPVVT